VSSFAAAAVPTRARRFVVVFGGLAAVNLAINLLSLVTGPLQARLLGPQGRGELALVLVVTGYAPVIGLSLGSFLAREITRTSERGVLLGTVALLSAALGTLGALCAYPVSRLFGDGDVQALIFAGLLLLPVGVVGVNLHGAYWGEERWRLHSLMRVISPVAIVCCYIVLALAGAFTVVGAALTVFFAGVLAMLPLWPLLRCTRGWGFDRKVARRGLAFGAKVSVAGAASQGNVRVDQLFVASLVSTRELGFYVVAGTLATATLLVSQALNLMVVPMVATGDHHGVRRILRITLALMLVAAIVLAVASAPLIHLIFGPAYDESVLPAQILCVGSVFVAGKGIVTAALVGHGRPGETAVVEVATFGLLVGTMLLVVPGYGAPGAAVVVMLTAAAGFAVLVLRTRRWLGGALGEYVVPSAADVRWLTTTIRNRTGRP
jgi:O-antigen/teichoic acid export membrane protein